MMVRILGYFEFDDENLTPGEHDGGLHQNLYDPDGKLVGHARFIPGEPDYNVYNSHYSVQNEQLAEQGLSSEEMARLITQVLEIVVVVVRSPRFQRFWHERAMPVLEAAWDRRPRRRGGRDASVEQLADDEAGEIVVDKTVLLVPEEPARTSSQELVIAAREYQTRMSSTEAQARYLLAMATRAFSDQQMELLLNAHIEEGTHFAELQHTLAQLTPQEAARFIASFEANPALLGNGRPKLVEAANVDRPGSVHLYVKKSRSDRRLF